MLHDNQINMKLYKYPLRLSKPIVSDHHEINNIRKVIGWESLGGRNEMEAELRWSLEEKWCRKL